MYTGGVVRQLLSPMEPVDFYAKFYQRDFVHIQRVRKPGSSKQCLLPLQGCFRSVTNGTRDRQALLRRSAMPQAHPSTPKMLTLFPRPLSPPSSFSLSPIFFLQNAKTYFDPIFAGADLEMLVKNLTAPSSLAGSVPLPPKAIALKSFAAEGILLATPLNGTMLNAKLKGEGATMVIRLEHLSNLSKDRTIHPGLTKFYNDFNVFLGGTTLNDDHEVAAPASATNAGGKGERGEGPKSDLRTTIHLYATGPKKGAQALVPHTDEYDVFVAQLAGSKTWTVCTPEPEGLDAVFATAAAAAMAAEKCELHLQNEDSKDACTFYTKSDLEEMDCTTLLLEAGDTLYLPKGMVHYAQAGAEGSLHMTASVERQGLTWAKLVEAALEGLVDEDADLEVHTLSTLLGIDLAQLAPVSGATLLATGEDAEQAAQEYLAAAVRGVLELVESAKKEGLFQIDAAQPVRPLSRMGRPLLGRRRRSSNKGTYTCDKDCDEDCNEDCDEDCDDDCDDDCDEDNDEDCDSGSCNESCDSDCNRDCDSDCDEGCECNKGYGTDSGDHEDCTQWYACLPARRFSVCSFVCVFAYVIGNNGMSLTLCSILIVIICVYTSIDWNWQCCWKYVPRCESE